MSSNLANGYSAHQLEFVHERIDAHPPCGRLGFCEPTDLTGNGRPDIIVGGLGAEYPITVGGKTIKLRYVPGIGQALKRRESNVFWYENPGWERHDVASAPDLSIGATLADISGNGRMDLVVGQNLGYELYWFEQPADPREPWTRHLITDDFCKYHDTAVGDLDDDGDDELVILSQRSEVVCYYDIPDQPRSSPWPTSHRHVIAENCNVEGVEIVDIDGDGRTELVAGPNVFRSTTEGTWTREQIGTDWQWTRLSIGDLTGDGQYEIVMSEGDLPYQGDRNGRLGYAQPPEWEVTIIDDKLSNPHTLQLADFDGNGATDIFVAEMGLNASETPRQFIYRNDGTGRFERTKIGQGIPTHEAKVCDLNGDDQLDIVGKSFTPTHHVDAWFRVD